MKYLALDFETANAARASACSVGLYLVDDSFQLIKSEEILIDPEGPFDSFNVMIHGITPDMVVGAPTFPDVYSRICSYVDPDTIVVCHNAGFDMSVIRHSCSRYDIIPVQWQYVCTYVFSRYILPGHISYSLDLLSEDLHLPSFAHHDALADAKACLDLLQHLLTVSNSTDVFALAAAARCTVGKIIDAESYVPCKHKKHHSNYSRGLDVSSVHVNPVENHPFYQKVVVFTGALASCTRQEAWEKVAKVGGLLSDSLTKKTNFLVTGYQDPRMLKGAEKSSKRLKAEQYLAKGSDIQILTEEEFYMIMSADYDEASEVSHEAEDAEL